MPQENKKTIFVDKTAEQAVTVTVTGMNSHFMGNEFLK